jgi:ribulose-phosphate 3-epimerase
MNLTDGAFLCLDIGSAGVHAVAARVSFGRIKSSANVFAESRDAAYALKYVADALEERIGASFDSAFVTGNFGDVKSEIFSRLTSWGGEHKIVPQDILEQALRSDDEDSFSALHVIPLRYDLGEFHNMSNAVGHTDRSLHSVFHSIAYSEQGMSRAKSALHAAHLESQGFFDPMFLMGRAARAGKETALFIDFGAEFTSVSLMSARGPMLLEKIKAGGADVTRAIAAAFHVTRGEAERLKISGMTLTPSDIDRFTPADSKHDITKFDLNDAAYAVFSGILESVRDLSAPAVQKYKPSKIYTSGGGSAIPGLPETLEKMFGLPVLSLGAFGAASALAEFVWNRESGRVAAYLARRKKWEKFFGWCAAPLRWRLRTRRRRAVPVMPSTLVWDMRSQATYSKFESAGIGIIHVDIMDGFYVQRIASGIDELRFIRAHTKALLHVHLMTENPEQWAAEAAAAGADTIIVSSGTNGVVRALREIRAAGRRAGIALHPDSPPEVIAPVLRDIDEVMVMSVAPGAAGQAFIENSVARIAALDNTRRRHNLSFKISVDGGINPETAKKCWAAGADLIAVGSFLSEAPDFAAAVQELMEK